MNTYQKVIYLYFKKDFSIREIAEIIPDELREYRELTYRGNSKVYPPLIAVQKIIGNELATLYLLEEREEQKQPKPRYNARPVIAVKNGKSRKFDNLRQAADELKIERKNITLCCNGKRNTAGGYRWYFQNAQ